MSIAARRKLSRHVMAGDKVIPVNDLNFESEVLKSDVPVLVDFSATWCQPCRAIAPFVNQLAGEYDGRVKVTTLDIDESPGTATRFQIRGVPTLLMFKNGQQVGQQVGAVPKVKIQALMDGAL
jgi:thioredoxin 1